MPLIYDPSAIRYSSTQQAYGLTWTLEKTESDGAQVWKNTKGQEAIVPKIQEINLKSDTSTTKCQARAIDGNHYRSDCSWCSSNLKNRLDLKSLAHRYGVGDVGDVGDVSTGQRIGRSNMEQPLKYEWTTAEHIRLGDIIHLGNGATVGPILRIKLDWKSNWAIFTDTDYPDYQCFITEQLKVVRRLK